MATLSTFRVSVAGAAVGLAQAAFAEAVRHCVQVMGRYGLIRDAKIERLYPLSRPTRIYEGASEALRPGIARALVDTMMSGDGDGAAR